MSLEAVLSWWSFLFLGVVVFSTQETLKRLFGTTSAFYHYTAPLWGPVLGTLYALIPGFPMPEGLVDTPASRALFGAVAGTFCSLSYKAVKRLAGADTKSYERRTMPPSGSVGGRP